MDFRDLRRGLIRFFFGLGLLFLMIGAIRTATNKAVSDWLSNDLLVAGAVFIIVAVGIYWFT
ncbi:MAG: hypothetical protein ABSB56_07310 [Nitrososphaerales archaeon]